jgi:uncharacterized protein (DUF2267 family)
MALPPDPYSERAAERLYQALAREGLPSRTEATRATEAVLCALAQRVSGGEFETLHDLLPDPFRGRLLACERHAAAPRTFSDADTFYQLVAEDLGRDASEVEPMARAVFAAIRSLLQEDEAEELATRLPAELEPLWRRPS